MRPGSLPKLENWQNLRSSYSEGGVSTSRFGEFTRHKFSRLPLIAARWVHCADGGLDAEERRGHRYEDADMSAIYVIHLSLNSDFLFFL